MSCNDYVTSYQGFDRSVGGGQKGAGGHGPREKKKTEGYVFQSDGIIGR